MSCCLQSICGARGADRLLSPLPPLLPPLPPLLLPLLPPIADCNQYRIVADGAA